ncbi:effector-binding domain-containing protein [Planomicrobium stackebrandtii]|uniref:Effector-binding domain-containing protein n=1 Tax=Planomicrobium stackebrandtii TaxID=253160 RepID=A0ABU0GU85_9BACL|nr:GyrI-like domain-containing protein [Planomicrobium stackebrandtii]MDQ0428924.1 effector-binding domain-containing protein [Planomicrobium stackebrandtii]
MVQKYISEPFVEERAEQPYVGIPILAGLAEWDKVNSLVGELFDWLKGKGIKPAGTPFFRYWCLGDSEGKYKMEVGLPVKRMVSGDDRVVASFIPGGSYLSALHKGHPDNLEKSLAALEQWALQEELDIDKRWEGQEEIWNGRFEFYVTDPETEPDLNKWAIRIAFLLMRDDAA